MILKTNINEYKLIKNKLTDKWNRTKRPETDLVLENLHLEGATNKRVRKESFDKWCWDYCLSISKQFPSSNTIQNKF